MGMYDSVYINIDKLPISDEDKGLFKVDKEFQTKDFDCELKSYHITDDGFLEKDEYDQQWDENAECVFGAFIGAKGALVCKNERRIRIDFHGDLYFYTYLTTNSKKPKPPPDWFGFIARFTNGKLESIKRTERY